MVSSLHLNLEEVGGGAGVRMCMWMTELTCPVRWEVFGEMTGTSRGEEGMEVGQAWREAEEDWGGGGGPEVPVPAGAGPTAPARSACGFPPKMSSDRGLLAQCPPLTSILLGTRPCVLLVCPPRLLSARWDGSRPSLSPPLTRHHHLPRKQKSSHCVLHGDALLLLLVLSAVLQDPGR